MEENTEGLGFGFAIVFGIFLALAFFWIPLMAFVTWVWVKTS